MSRSTARSLARSPNSLSFLTSSLTLPESHIVPDLLSAFDPSAVLAASFSGNSAAIGQPLTIDQVKEQPELTVNPAAAAADAFAQGNVFTVASEWPGHCYVVLDEGGPRTRADAGSGPRRSESTMNASRAKRREESHHARVAQPSLQTHVRTSSGLLTLLLLSLPSSGRPWSCRCRPVRWPGAFFLMHAFGLDPSSRRRDLTGSLFFARPATGSLTVSRAHASLHL